MANDTAKTVTTNIVPVQGIFLPEPTFDLVTLIGPAGTPFYANVNPEQSGLHITNSTIDSTTIGATTPSTGVFTNISTTTGTISSAPSGPTSIVNQAYVDAIAQGLSFKQPALLATTGNITLSGEQMIDGFMTSSDRILVWQQSDAAENGIYLSSSGAWTRTSDANTWDELLSAYIFVTSGVIWGGGSFVCLAQPGGTLGVTDIDWLQFSNNAIYTAGTGLTLTGFQFSITNIGTAGTYGTASSVPVLTTNAQGQVTGVVNTSIAINGNQITSGTVSPTYGGTGVNNGTNTLTWNSSYTLDQSVASGAAPTFLGTNFSAIPNSALSNNSVTYNGVTVALGSSGTITAINPYALTLGTGLSGTSYDGSSAVTAAIANTGVTAASYTILNATVNAQGQLTAASSASTTGSGNVVLAGSPTINGDWGSFNSIAFDTTPTTPPTAEGTLYWDSADGNQTLSLVMANGDAIQQIGEETYYRIKASSAITEGQVVMFTGTVGASGALTGAPATGLTASTASYIMGVATQNIAHNGWGYVTAFGLVRGINTTGGAEAWVDGQILYYDPTVPGGLTKNLPSAPNAKVQVCAVVNAASNGSLFIRPSFGGILGQYEGDVGFSSVSAYDLIQRNSANTAWVNTAPSSISVGKATNLAGGGAGQIPYQSAVDTTAFLSAGTTGQVLTSNGTSAPSWTTPTAYATVTDDTTTNSTFYPLFANQTTGNIATEYTSSTKYQYNPSTGLLTATGFSGSGASLTNLNASNISSGTIGSSYVSGSYTGITGVGTLSAGTWNASTIGYAYGGTGLTAAPTAGQLLIGNGSGYTLANITAGTGISVTNGAGSITIASTVTGVTIADDTTSASNYYPLYARITSGTASTEYTSSTKYTFNPSTGALSATSFNGAGTGLTGTASSLSIGGTALNVTGVVAIANGGTGQTTANAAFNALIPSQTSNSGKYLTTDGTNTSWATVDALPSQTGNAGKYLTTNGTVASWATVNFSPAGSTTQVQYNNAGSFGASSSFTFDGTALTAPVQISSNGITVNSATVSATYSIPSGSNGMSAGPVSVATGITVTVPTGSTWVIV